MNTHQLLNNNQNRLLKINQTKYEKETALTTPKTGFRFEIQFSIMVSPLQKINPIITDKVNDAMFLG